MESYLIYILIAQAFGTVLTLVIIFKKVLPMRIASEKARLDSAGSTLFGSDNYSIQSDGPLILGHQLSSALISEMKGKEIKIKDSVGGKNSTAQTTIWVPANNIFSLTVVREQALHGIGKGLGMIKDVRIGDPTLDAEFVFKSKEEHRTRNLCNSTSFRNLLLDLKNDPSFWQLLLISPEDITTSGIHKHLHTTVQGPGLFLLRRGNLKTVEQDKTMLLPLIENVVSVASEL